MKFTKYHAVALLSLFMVSLGFAEELVGLRSYPKEQVHLFLLVGQSNMAGRGEVEDIDREVNPRVFALSKDGEWIPAVDPIHYDKASAGVGLAKSFALELLEADDDIVIGLIPAACGGSPISSWVPGGYHDQTNSYPYDDAIKRIQNAREDGVLKGILWHQGESDSNANSSSLYAENLRRLIERFRVDLGDNAVPFVIGQLGQFEDKPWNAYRKQVNDAQVSLSAELDRVGFVYSDELMPKADNTHFDSTSLRMFGRRYAEVYLKMIGE